MASKRVRGAVLLALCLLPALSRAVVTLVGIVPSAPIAGQEVAIRVALGPTDEDWGFYSERDGDVVRGYLTLGDLYQPPQDYRTRDCPIGSFPPGQYTVELYVNGGMPIRVGSATMIVSAIAVPVDSTWVAVLLVALVGFGGVSALRRIPRHSI